MTGALVIAIAGGGHLSERGATVAVGRVGDSVETFASAASGSPVSRSEKCPAHRAVRFYSRRIAEHRAKMGAGLSRVVGTRRSCPRYLAHVLQRKARAWRLRVERWVEYHYDWRAWLPDKWQRIGACETGYGQRPGQWTWNSGTYQGAFGFYHGTWDQYKPAGAPSEAYLATPREQYQCALNVYAAHGYGAWGCGGA